jgi:Arc/MetJ family transcription regulator
MEVVAVRTNIDIDDGLLAEAAKIAGTTTKKSTVEAALRELIRQHKVRRVLELRGSFDWEGDLQEMRRSRFE